MDRCPMCGNIGWILDCNDIGKPGPRMVEFIPCLLPDCPVSGGPVQNLSFALAPFNSVSKHPKTGKIMSVSVERNR